MSVGRICTREVDLADAEETAWQAAERMHQRTVGCLIVLNPARKPVGIITDRDLVIRAMARSKDPYQTRVDEVMTPDPVCVTEQTSINDALAQMRQGGFRRLPVVDGEGALCGLVTLDDILLLFCQEFRDIGGVLQKETPRAAAETGLPGR